MRSYRYRDFFLPGAPQELGYPKVAVADADSVFVSDWNGRVRRIDIQSVAETAVTQSGSSNPYTGNTIDQLCISPRNPEVVAVTARTSGFFVGKVGDSEFKKLSSDCPGPANCLAYSPSGAYLAVGHGYYALHRGPVEGAFVEVWSVREGESVWCEATILVPGICVDRIAWPTEGREFVCVTGLRNQKGGFLIPFDKKHTAERYYEIPLCAVRGLVYDYPQAIVLDSEQLVAYSVYDGEARWSIPVANANGLAHDSARDEVVLTTGAVVSTKDGSIVCNLVPLVECSSIAVRLGGGGIGISQSGVIRIWEEADV